MPLKSALSLVFALICSLFVSKAQIGNIEWSRIDSIVGHDHWDLSAFDANNCAVSIDSAGASSLLRITDDGWKTCRTVFLDSSTFYTKPVHEKWEYSSIAYPSKDLLLLTSTENGALIRSTDGGSSWDTIFFPEQTTIAYIDMLDRDHGTMYGNRTSIYATWNAGLSWKLIRILNEEDLTLRRVQMVTPSDIYAKFGKQGTNILAVSRDSGLTWDLRPMPDHAQEFRFVSSLTGWCVAEYEIEPGSLIARDQIFKTTDGGNTWINQMDQMVDPMYGLQEISAADSLRLIAGGRQGKAYHSLDGGATWERVQLPIDTNFPCGILEVKYTREGVAYATVQLYRFYKFAERTMNVLPSTADQRIKTPPQFALSGELLRIEIGKCTGQRLALLDALGKEREVQFLSTIGNVAFRAPRESGIYFLRLECDETLSARVETISLLVH